MAETAHAIVLDIARAVAAREGWPGPVPDRALFWAYVAGAFDDTWIADEYDAAINELLEPHPMRGLSLHGGAARWGFALTHISEQGAADASLDAIDSLIAEQLETWDGEFDLIRGLAGIGVYLFERGDGVRALIDKVVDRLFATSELGPQGRTWLVRPELLTETQREASPDGRYDCGVAHGVPGVLVFLARAAQIGNVRARSAVEEASRWLDAQQIADAAGCRYPAWINRDLVTQRPGRHAWCYGDLGIAIATFGVARRLGSSTEPALGLARHTIAIPFEHSQVVDAGLCHGAAGLAHLYNRLFQATGEAELRDAARTWFAHVFRLRGRPEGVTGFAEYLLWPGDPQVWRPTTAILTGAMGIALSLLAAIRPDEPNWDRMLMCDL